MANELIESLQYLFTLCLLQKLKEVRLIGYFLFIKYHFPFGECASYSWVEHSVNKCSLKHHHRITTIILLIYVLFPVSKSYPYLLLVKHHRNNFLDLCVFSNLLESLFSHRFLEYLCNLLGCMKLYKLHVVIFLH